MGSADTTLAAGLSAYRERADPAERRVDGVTVGERAVLVELGDPAGAGLAHRPPGAATPPETVAGLLAPITGAGEPSRFERALAVATLNALWAPHVEWRRGDPMGEGSFAPGVDVVATVGFFAPALDAFRDVELRVVERDSGATRRDTYPPSETEAAFSGADVVFITGSTLVYGGLERYLAAAPAGAAVAVVGATASFHPPAFFGAGVDVLAGAAVADPERARRAVRDGACGTDLHDRGVEKVYAVAPGADDLPIRFDSNHVTK